MTATISPATVAATPVLVTADQSPPAQATVPTSKPTATPRKRNVKQGVSRRLRRAGSMPIPSCSDYATPGVSTAMFRRALGTTPSAYFTDGAEAHRQAWPQ
ncbi:hypothetical protein [Streptomyces sp. NPDC056707]|uniref:hypothetical protein n=1 Tax=Streptomyces sp. NPDC056707 TaxID=3345919 RepID=UPI0036B5ED09